MSILNRSAEPVELTGEDLSNELRAATASYRAQVQGIVADAKDRQAKVQDQIAALEAEDDTLDALLLETADLVN